MAAGFGMERRLALWVGVPFLGVAWTLVAVVALAPGLIHGRLLMALLLVLAGAGVFILLIRIFVRDRAGSPLLDTLYPIAGILVAVGVGFHQEVGAIARGVFDYVMPSGATSGGMRFARADDGQFHVRLMVEGSAVDFMVDLDRTFNVLTPDVPKQIGINPSLLIYNQRIEVAAGAAEYAVDVVLPKVRLGSTVIENLPVKVFATNRWGNVLGKTFFEQLKSWRVDGDTLIIVR
jgi:clan AA aspartic protease (TIGR02281 family)